MPMQVAVVGGGSWGTTVASLAARNAPTTLWARRTELAEEIATEHTNAVSPRLRADAARLFATDSLEEAVGSADLLVMGVPSHGMRATLGELAPFVRPWVPVVSLSKGIEVGTKLG